MNFFAFDIGGTNIKAGVFDEEKLIYQYMLPADKDCKMQHTLSIIAESIEDVSKNNNIINIDGIGFAQTGIVDSINKKSINSNKKYTDAHEIDYIRWAKDCFDATFIIENDARLACIGEWKYGAAKGCDNFSIMTLGTGIGTSSVIGGRVLRGKNFKAGILGGHFTIDYTSEKCNCGNIGCAESIASSWKLHDLVDKMIGKNNTEFNEFLSNQSILYKDVSFKEIFEAASLGIESAKFITDYCIHIWAVVAVNLIHAYDSEKIILQGGITSGFPKVILAGIRTYIKKFRWIADEDIEIARGILGNYSAIYGLHYLFNHNSDLSMMI